MQTVLCVTGKIGVGKSTIINHLAKHSAAHVFDCDKVVSMLYGDPVIKRSLVDNFKKLISVLSFGTTKVLGLFNNCVVYSTNAFRMNIQSGLWVNRD